MIFAVHTLAMAVGTTAPGLRSSRLCITAKPNGRIYITVVVALKCDRFHRTVPRPLFQWKDLQSVPARLTGNEMKEPRLSES